MKLTVYTKEGKKKGNVELSDSIFAVAFKPALIRQVILAFLANARTPIAHAKTRAEVRGGGRKPWKQKGTGRARHGSTRSPIWVGGGVTHGPRKDKKYSQKVNKKMRLNALLSTISRKLTDNEVLLIDDLSFDTPKAREAKTILNNLAGIENFEKLAYKKRNTALIVTPEKDVNLNKSFNNFGNVEVSDAMNVNAYDIMKHKYILIVNPGAVEGVLKERTKIKG
jgi:large subunit ribosomal protein L4